MAGTYLLQKNGSGQYWWNLRAGNNEKILTSEMYATKSGALAGIESCRVNSPLEERYYRFNDKAGAPRFDLRAANNQVLGVSEAYASTVGRDNGIASCKSNGPTATLDDRT